MVDDRLVTMQVRILSSSTGRDTLKCTGLMCFRLLTAVGYRRPRTIPVSRCRVLPRRRLLRPRLRRQQLQVFRDPGQLEGRVPHPG